MVNSMICKVTCSGGDQQMSDHSLNFGFLRLCSGEDSEQLFKKFLFLFFPADLVQLVQLLVRL